MSFQERAIKEDYVWPTPPTPRKPTLEDYDCEEYDRARDLDVGWERRRDQQRRWKGE